MADRYCALRLRIRKIFEESRQTFGSERIRQALRAGNDGKVPVRVSEKVVRRLMKEEKAWRPSFAKRSVVIAPTKARSANIRKTWCIAASGLTSPTSSGSPTSPSSACQASSAISQSSSTT